MRCLDIELNTYIYIVKYMVNCKYSTEFLLKKWDVMFDAGEHESNEFAYVLQVRVVGWIFDLQVGGVIYKVP